MYVPAKLRNQLPILSAIVATAVAVSALHGSALIPSSGGTISGCYRTSNGNLRIIDAEAGANCNGNEAALNWSQQVSDSSSKIKKILNVPYDTTHQDYFNVPEFGIFSAGCSGFSDLKGLFFENTSETTLSLYSSQGVPTPTITPGETAHLFEQLGGELLTIYFTPETENPNNNILSLTVSERFSNTEPYACKFISVYEVI